MKFIAYRKVVNILYKKELMINRIPGVIRDQLDLNFTKVLLEEK